MDAFDALVEPYQETTFVALYGGSVGTDDGDGDDAAASGVTFSWTFGDATLTGRTVTHHFTQLQIYPLTMRAYSAAGVLLASANRTTICRYVRREVREERPAVRGGRDGGAEREKGARRSTTARDRRGPR